MAEETLILIVDDDPDAVTTLGKILKLKGYQVEGAVTAAGAITRAKEKFYNIIFIDVRLPDASGLEVLKAVREKSEDTVPIMITAYASIDSSVAAIDQGAYSYITKPVNIDQVLNVITRALEKQHLFMENKRLLRELSKANEELKKLDQLKSEFIATVSHELRTPLTTTLGIISNLLDGVVGPVNEKQREYLTMASADSARLGRLIDNLLDLSKLEARKVELRKKETNLTALVDQSLFQLKAKFEEKKIEVVKAVAGDLPLLLVDQDKILQVMLNLLSNAIKFTPEGGKITVTAKKNNQSQVESRIADTGIGIAQADLPRLFQKFSQINRQVGPGARGTGLGLVISKEIIELHHGRIWAESALGQGSSFSFTLPIE